MQLETVQSFKHMRVLFISVKIISESVFVNQSMCFGGLLAVEDAIKG